jgi:predicted nucleotidyltransferase
MHPLPQDALAFARETRVLPVVSSQGVRADLIFAALPAELEAIRRARAMRVGGRTVNVASLEDLILMKLVSEREKDAEDARRLLVRFKGKIDRDYLEPRLSELAEALARPGILEVFLAGLKSRAG